MAQDPGQGSAQDLQLSVIREPPTPDIPDNTNGVFICESNGYVIAVTLNHLSILAETDTTQHSLTYKATKAVKDESTANVKLTAKRGDGQNAQKIEFEYEKKTDSWTNGSNNFIRYDNDTYNSNNNNSNNNKFGFDRMEHIVVIGKTGYGKSSLISLLTNNSDIERSAGSDACTKATSCSFVSVISQLQSDNDNDDNGNNSQSKPDVNGDNNDNTNGNGNSNADNNYNGKRVIYCFYDTQGIGDTDTDGQDSRINQDIGILNQIQFTLRKNGAKSIKIIWMVNGANRAEATLQDQASFINKFGLGNNIYLHAATGNNNNASNNSNGNNNSNDISVWDSVLIIISEPKQMESISANAQGTVKAVEKVTQDGFKADKWVVNQNLTGYINMDWFTKQDKINQATMIYDMQQQNPAMRDSMHLYKNEEAKNLVFECIQNGISKSYPIQWYINKCTKCGTIGDVRFSDHIPCHTEAKKIHKKDVTPIHYGKIKEDFQRKYHKGNSIKYHKQPQARRRYHTGKKILTHSQSMSAWTEAAGNSVKSGNAFESFMGVLGFIETPIGAPLLSGMAVLSGRCAYCERKMDTQGCMVLWDCCNNYARHDGCRSFPNNEERFMCCDQVFNRETDGVGGEKTGCYQYYDCCPEKVKAVIVRIGVDANDEVQSVTKFGLTIPQSELPKCATECTFCMTDIESSDSNENDQDKGKDNGNGNGNNDQLKCAFRYDCCGKTGEWADRADESLKCHTVCKTCNEPWGETKGCQATENHVWQSV